MRKTFIISGYAANRRGYTTGIRYTLTAKNASEARAAAACAAVAEGYSCVRISSVLEARA